MRTTDVEETGFLSLGTGEELAPTSSHICQRAL